MQLGYRTARLSTQVISEIKKRMTTKESLDSALRSILGMKASIRFGKYSFLDNLAIGQAVTLPWKAEPGKFTYQLSQNHLTMAARRSSKRTGFTLRTKGTPQGLLVTRTA